jgi:hypothetical protein
LSGSSKVQVAERKILQVTSVHRIMNGKSNRPKERVKILDDFYHCLIKRSIHGLYSRKIAPTVSIIHKEIKDSFG